MVSGQSARRRALSTAGFYGLALLFMLPTIFVFYWMITLSLKPQVEATAYPPSFVRFSVTAAGYREVFTKYPFFLYTWNSLVVATGCTVLGLAIGLPAAYSASPSACGRPQIPARRWCGRSSLARIVFTACSAGTPRRSSPTSTFTKTSHGPPAAFEYARADSRSTSAGTRLLASASAAASGSEFG